MEGERSLLAESLENEHQSPLMAEVGGGGFQESASTLGAASSGSLSPNGSVAGELRAFLPRHSDFTVHMSNISTDLGDETPERLDDSPPRRSVLGGRVDRKYGRYYGSNQQHEREMKYARNYNSLHQQQDGYQVLNDPSSMYLNRRDSENTLPTEHLDPLTDEFRNISDLSTQLTPPGSPGGTVSALSPLTPASLIDATSSNKAKRRRWAEVHETVHAQSLLLGLAFLTIWSPQNMMAPNLTEMADDFDFKTASERDTYLGSNLALATGVLSLPIAGGIGFLADMYSRKHLFVVTVTAGGIFAALTGVSRSYHWLFLARLCNGGCMSGSVPVAFSLLGDLFDTSDRNAASSGLTAMMGMGIIGGQVYAGVVGSTLGWSHAFYMSFAVTILTAILVLLLVQEPLRGGKEKVLQDMLEQGAQYERKLTWKGFLNTMTKNASNSILLWQGFTSSIPWGIMFVFLNDYLSQERGFSVPDATYLVFVFGVGCAVGGIAGGYFGGLFQARNPSYLPLFMAATTFLGMFPFLALLNGTFTNAHGYQAIGYSFLAGMIASLPSVSVRPCIINVNPPESRGAALTAANLIIQLARGIGPSCITLLGAIFGANRRISLNITLIVFWTVSSIQLLFLARSLPVDQETMEQELATYAANAMEMAGNRFDEEESIVSIEDRMTSFDVGAARQSLKFVGDAIREIEEEFRIKRTSLLSCKSEEEEDETDDDDRDAADIEHKRNVWLHQQQALQQENGTDDRREGSREAGRRKIDSQEDEALPADEKTSLLRP